MPSFGKKSQSKIDSMDSRIQEIANEVIKDMDISADHGYRGMSEQDDLFDIGASKVRFPHSAHNQNPSLAGDFRPYPTDWNDLAQFTRMRERFHYHAGRLGYKLKPMIIFNDGTGDYPHIELAL